MIRGEVYYINLSSNFGSEQGGNRPCVIIQNDFGNTYSGTVIVAPMTTQTKKQLPTHVQISSQDRLHPSTIILLEQIRVVDKQRFGDFVCRLSEETMERVDKAIKISLALNKEERSEKKMDSLQIFEKENFGSIRTVMVENEPWFAAVDVCKALGLSNPTMATQRLDDDERAKFNLGVHDSDGTNCVNEYGLYNLILTSRKKEAREFKRWITHEVIPQIRKTGAYQQKRMTPEEMMRVQLGMIDGHEERIKALEDTMTIDHGQQRVLERTVNKTVIDVLDGKQSNAYKEISKKVFAECNRDLKNRFNVNSRDDVPRKDYEQAIEYAKSWRPCANTMLMIRDCNAQMNI